MFVVPTPMLLTLTIHHPPGTILGESLKSWASGSAPSYPLAFGQVHAFYTAQAPNVHTIALLLELNTLSLPASGAYMAHAVSEAFAALLGTQDESPKALCDHVLPIEVQLPVLQCTPGPALLERFFAPLGYTVHIDGVLPATDPHAAEVAALLPCYQVTLRANKRLAELVEQLCVGLPLCEPHSPAELRESIQERYASATAWLSEHPQWADLCQHYGRLLNDADEPAPAVVDAVLATLGAGSVRRVLDLRCGGGHLLAALVNQGRMSQVSGMEESPATLERARERLRLEHRPADALPTVSLFPGLLTLRDQRLTAYDAACLLDLTCHLERHQLSGFARLVLSIMRPNMVLLTLEPGPSPSARFQWSTAEFKAWAQEQAERYGYELRVTQIEGSTPESSTCLGAFTR